MTNACGKIRYRDRIGALLALANCERADKTGHDHRREERAYRCPDCRGWHLTSQPGRRSGHREGEGTPHGT